MAEYIDTSTEITIWDICEDGAVHTVKTTVAQFLLGHLKCNDLINGIPIADVRPVVTCEKCKYNNACLTQMFVEDNSIIPFDRSMFFCADGVAGKEDGELWHTNT